MVRERQRLAARDRHQRLVEDDAGVCDRDVPATRRPHEDVVDPLRGAARAVAVERVGGIPGAAGEAGGGIRETRLLQPLADPGRRAGLQLKSPASTTQPSNGAAAAAIASASCLSLRSGTPLRRCCR